MDDRPVIDLSHFINAMKNLIKNAKKIGLHIESEDKEIEGK